MSKKNHVTFGRVLNLSDSIDSVKINSSLSSFEVNPTCLSEDLVLHLNKQIPVQSYSFKRPNLTECRKIKRFIVCCVEQILVKEVMLRLAYPFSSRISHMWKIYEMLEL